MTCSKEKKTHMTRHIPFTENDRLKLNFLPLSSCCKEMSTVTPPSPPSLLVLFTRNRYKKTYFKTKKSEVLGVVVCVCK